MEPVVILIIGVTVVVACIFLVVCCMLCYVAKRKSSCKMTQSSEILILNY
jgi:preprotein translocase subunit SecG